MSVIGKAGTYMHSIKSSSVLKNFANIIEVPHNYHPWGLACWISEFSSWLYITLLIFSINYDSLVKIGTLRSAIRCQLTYKPVININLDKITQHPI